MAVDDELLERFAKAIDVPAFLWQQGFRVPQEREPGQLRMTHPISGETLVLELDPQRGWTYASDDRQAQRGSIADYLIRREGITREQCLERLVACADQQGERSDEAARYRAVLRERPVPLETARREHEQARIAEQAARRVLERCGVPDGRIDEARFGRARCEEHAIKLTSEPATLWASRYRPGDTVIVLVERPIDAIAYERTAGKGKACYIATGSDLNDTARRQLAHILAEAPARVGVVLAFGGDQTGRQLAGDIRGLAPTVRSAFAFLVRKKPAMSGVSASVRRRALQGASRGCSPRGRFFRPLPEPTAVPRAWRRPLASAGRALRRPSRQGRLRGRDAWSPPTRQSGSRARVAVEWASGRNA